MSYVFTFRNSGHGALGLLDVAEGEKKKMELQRGALNHKKGTISATATP